MLNKFIFALTFLFAEWTKYHVHMVSFCNLIGTARARHWKSTTFPVNVTRLSPPVVFVEMFVVLAKMHIAQLLTISKSACFV